MIKYFKDYKGRFKEAYVYTNKNECLGCRTKGVAEYIDTLEKALDKACEELESLDKSHAEECNKALINSCFSQMTFGYQTKEEWKELLLKEVKADE